MSEQVLSNTSELVALLPLGVADPSRTDTEFELTVGVAEMIRNLTLSPGHTTPHAMSAMLHRFVEALPGADCASITSQPNSHRPPETLAATAQAANATDQLQYRTGQGPCLQALTSVELIQVDNLSTDPRWPELSAAAHRSALHSVLSIPVTAVGNTAQSLNVYAERPNGFSTAQHAAAYLSGAVTGLALTALRERDRAEHLSIALDTNRQIGAAMGILMAEHRCNYDEAFTALRTVSQHLHRKLREVADEVVFTGALPARAPRHPLASEASEAS